MKVLEIFIDIAKKIPRCSGNTAQMHDYLIGFAHENSLSVTNDKAGNVLISKGNPKVCLQAHYDMVCLGDGSPVEIVNDGVVLKAKNSTLGADNGIGLAMMIALLDEATDIECLFTNDEEIGLLGARALELPIVSPYILNLDAEDEGFVYIGCAGGFEVVATKKLRPSEIDLTNIISYTIDGLPGGHSGIDIEKDIPNAIIENLKIIKIENGKIITFSGGEKLNSIPKAATCEYVKSEEDTLIDFLLSIPHGVIEKNIDLAIPNLSVNFAKLSIADGVVRVQLYVRAMEPVGMRKFEQNIVDLFVKNEFEVQTAGHYSPWEPATNDFAQFVRNIMKKYFFTSGFKAIHAGLECGVLKEIMPDKLFASIGPNIRSPHTLDESVEIESVNRTFEALREVVRTL